MTSSSSPSYNPPVILRNIFILILLGQCIESRQPIPKCSDGRPMVETKTGKYCGKRKEVKWFDSPATTVQMYLGIKFAQPPIGRYRFRKPVPIDERPSNIYEASEHGASCHQVRDTWYNSSAGALMWVPGALMGEDCLFLNVWVPEKSRDEDFTKKSKNKNLPVMVWIYGGGFYTGTTSLSIYDGEYLASRENVIVASMNYRVGPFGFIYLGTEDVPGNMGLWDQRLAMKWIKENIVKFGGNPDQITIFGESAGSVSVSAHVISPWSHAFFRNGIMQSGTVLGYWGLIDRTVSEQRTLKFIQNVGCNIRTTKRMILKCLRGISTNKISNTHSIMFDPTSYFSVPFPPVLDDHFFPYGTSQAFRQINHIKPTGALLFGMNENEASYFLLYAFVDTNQFNKGHQKIIIKSRENYLEKLERVLDLRDPKLNKMVMEYTDFEYTNYSQPVNSKTLVQRIESLSSDRTFKCPTIEMATQAINEFRVMNGPGRRTQTLPVYFYLFKYRSKHVPWPAWMGMIHGYEIEYAFGIPHSETFQRQFYNFTDEERRFSDVVMRYWANFARSDDPNVNADGSHVTDIKNKNYREWPEFNNVSESYMIFGDDRSLSTGTQPKKRQCTFWRKWFPAMLRQAAQNHARKSRTCRHVVRAVQDHLKFDNQSEDPQRITRSYFVILFAAALVHITYLRA